MTTIRNQGTDVRSAAPKASSAPAAEAGKAAAAAATATVAGDSLKLSSSEPAKQEKAEAEPKKWTTSRILKTAGTGAASFMGGATATWVVDLLFHFGNNGGTAWPGGIYLAAAGLAAAGGMALYNHFKSK